MFLKYMYIIETFIAVILNQTQNSRHSIYYATLFAIYWLQLHAALIYLVDYILQRLIQKAPGLGHEKYVSLASAE
ncbi:hypothetical protein T03_1847 [Trichinella britovi]|uniref:Uncharacterized protein n=1 Tax=Trichinella britovi TaxID=45882 RepID=A0A0V1C9F0_TRIBR|nr:hypothetical protein T03_1847 [Trichinella britovi]